MKTGRRALNTNSRTDPARLKKALARIRKGATVVQAAADEGVSQLALRAAKRAADASR